MYAMNRCREERGKLHTNSLIKGLLRIDNIAVESVFFEENDGEEVLVVRVRPYSRQMGRCPSCLKRCSGYDSARRIRRWRSLDLGSTRVYLEANAPRVHCREHGVIVAKVPWARHDSDYTHDFEMAVTYLRQ